MGFFKRFVRSKARDETTDAERFGRLVGALEESAREARAEYDGLLQRIRLLSSQQVDIEVYAIWPSSDADRATAKAELAEQLAYAVERTKTLLDQIGVQDRMLAELEAKKDLWRA